MFEQKKISRYIERRNKKVGVWRTSEILHQKRRVKKTTVVFVINGCGRIFREECVHDEAALAASMKQFFTQFQYPLNNIFVVC